MWGNTGTSAGLLPGRRTLGPLFLICVTPPAAIVVWYTMTSLNGSIALLISQCMDHGGLSMLRKMWPVPTGFDLLIVAVYSIFELVLLRFLPGRLHKGPITPMGNQPIYRDNGLFAHIITLAVFLLCTQVFHLFPASIIYDRMGPLLALMNYLALTVCLLLYFKGKYMPSSSDSGTSGNFVFDFYWGTELYPRVAGIDVKQFTNCRFAMMGWSLILLSYAFKQFELYGSVSNAMIVGVLLQIVYCTKFFIWEMGYMDSIDIMHDRAGYYICWGVLAWLPCVYTAHTLYLVNHPVSLHPALFWFILLAGLGCIYMNYDCDRQRQEVRAKKGECTVWGSKPVLIRASYTTDSGEPRTSLLLASGYWSLSRHFNYVPEIAAAFFWCVPALFGHVLPHFYWVYLTLLLVDRAYRDDRRCSDKYGKHWVEYCKLVPSRIIPCVL